MDVSLARILHAGATPAVLALCASIRALGTRQALVVLAAGVAALLALRRTWLLFVGWAAAVAGTGVLNAALQYALHRPRRPLVAVSSEPLVGFPSGHALGAIVVYGMIAYLVVLHVRRAGAQRAIVTATGLLVLLICASELVLGTYYFTDVAGGLAAGGMWLSAVVTGLEVARLKREALPREAVLREHHVDRRQANDNEATGSE